MQLRWPPALSVAPAEVDKAVPADARDGLPLEPNVHLSGGGVDVSVLMVDDVPSAQAQFLERASRPNG
jgi:hypothetical protein